jgi:hypothetical protein
MVVLIAVHDNDASGVIVLICRTWCSWENLDWKIWLGIYSEIRIPVQKVFAFGLTNWIEAMSTSKNKCPLYQFNNL